MNNLNNYPQPPVLNCEQRQIMLGLAYSAYTGEGITTPSPESLIKSEITAALPQITYTPVGGAQSTLANWHIVWGPVAYTVPGSLKQDNLMFVVQNGTTSQYAVVIRGTNFASEVDWLLEDLNVNAATSWPINAASWPASSSVPSTSGATVSESVSIDLNILLTMQDAVTTTQTFKSFLLSITNTPVNICVTGHSLGGMLASTLALYLLETQKMPNVWDTSGTSTVCFVSFAAPTAGNVAFANYSNQKFIAATRPPATMWDTNMNTNGDVVACSFDIAPMAYTSLNLYNFQTPAAGAMFSIYQSNIDFSSLGVPDKYYWDAFQSTLLAKLAALTVCEQYTQLTGADDMPVQGIFNGVPPDSSDGTFSGYLAAFLEQAVWQHSNSYPNIFGMADSLLGSSTSPSVINRNIPPPPALPQVTLSSVLPVLIDTDINTSVTITGSGFSALIEPTATVIGVTGMNFTNSVAVNDTTLTVNINPSLLLGNSTQAISVQGYSSGGVVTSTNSVSISIKAHL